MQVKPGSGHTQSWFSILHVCCLSLCYFQQDTTIGFWSKSSIEVPTNYRNVFTFDFKVTSLISNAFVAIDDVYIRDGGCNGLLGNLIVFVDQFLFTKYKYLPNINPLETNWFCYNTHFRKTLARVYSGLVFNGLVIILIIDSYNTFYTYTLAG